MKPFILFLFLTLSGQVWCQNEEVTSLVRSNVVKFDDEIIRDNYGNIYGSHFDGNSVSRWAPDGNTRLVARGFTSANGITLDSQGNLFVADPGANRIYKLDTSGTFLDTIVINKPAGLQKMGGSDTLLVTSWQDNKLMKLAPDGSFADYIVGQPLNGPFALAFDETTGRYFIGNFNNRQLFEIRGDTLAYLATVPAPTSSNNKWLGGMVATNHTLWACSMNANRIYKVYPDYTDSVSLFAGGNSGHLDGPIQSATFTMPNGLWINPAGDSLFVSEFDRGYLRLIYTPQPNALEDKSELQFKIYPNPMLDVLNIEISEESIMEVYNIQGQLVIDENLKVGEQQFNVSFLPKGSYTLVIGDVREIILIQ